MSAICSMTNKEFNQTVKRFKEVYPELVQYGNSYEAYRHMSIIVYIPTKGKVIYEYLDNDLTWLEKREDILEKKRHDSVMRPKTYTYFCFVVEQYMQEHHMTQQEFSDLVGISRRSLIKYLQGHSVPKVSTMRKICENIGIDI